MSNIGDMTMCYKLPPRYVTRLILPLAAYTIMSVAFWIWDTSLFYDRSELMIEIRSKSQIKNISIFDTRESEVAVKKSWMPHMGYLRSTDETIYPATQQKFLPAQTLLEFEHNKTVYRVGDEIRLKIHLRYQPHNPYGGDNLRATMHDFENAASISGYVIDHRNGSYTIIFKALWEGNCEILIQVKYTRIEIAYIYETRRQMTTVRTIHGVYDNNKKRTIVKCLPLRSAFNDPNTVCEYTKLNGEVPWYCQKPINPTFKCEHLIYLAASSFNEEAIHKQLPHLSKFWRPQFQTKKPKLIVKGATNNGVKHERRIPYCRDFNKRALWTMPSPVGYFYGGQWKINHCASLITKQISVSECVRNKHFIFYGDSTMLQWYKDLFGRLNCSGMRPIAKAYHELLGRNDHLNLKLQFVRHNMPGNVNNSPHLPYTEGMSFNSTPVHNLTDTVAHDATPIVIIHLYFHYSYYHQSVYRSRMKILKNSIQEILKNRPESRILIKGPHLIQKKTIGTCDYFAYVYRTIMIEELSEVLNKVVYLDYMDMSNAILLKDIHPDAPLVSEMVNQMLAYIC